MPVGKFPYKDTLVPIEKISVDYPYASNLLSAVILERCLKDFAERKGVDTNKFSTLGKIIVRIKEYVPADDMSYMEKIKKLRDDYIHSNKRTKSKEPNNKIRDDQHRADNEKFDTMLKWVRKNQYF